MSDGQGNFKIQSSKKVDSLVFKAPFHRTLNYKVISDSIDLDIRLVPFSIFLPIVKSQGEAEFHLLDWQANNTFHDMNNLRNTSYKINRVNSIKSSDVRKFKSNFNSYLSLIGKRLVSYDRDHYLLYTEGNEQVEYKNEHSYERNIQSMQSIGIDNPLELSDGKLLYELALNDDYWRIGSRFFSSPLKGNFQKRYNYQIVDTFQTEEGELLLIAFHPKLNKKTGKVRGFIYYHPKSKFIKAIWAESAIETKSRIIICAEFENRNGIHVYKSTNLSQNLTEIQSYSTLLKLQDKTSYYDYIEDSGISKRHYDELVMEWEPKEYSKDIVDKNDSLIANTVVFYQRNYDLKNIYSGLTFGKKLFDGHIPFGKFQMDIQRFISFNNHEGLRLGAGLSTSETFRQKDISEAYFAYGFKDERFKFGLSQLFFTDKKYWNFIRLHLSRDVYESGNVQFEQQEKFIFPSERLRRFGISVMDNASILGIESNIKIVKYLQGRFGFTLMDLAPTYDYTFQTRNQNSFQYNDLTIGFRFAFGEERIRLGRTHIIKSQNYPVVFFKWTNNNRNTGSDFNFNRYDLRINFQRHILGFGKSSFQINAGVIDKSIPYHRLYGAMGGLRNFSVMFHNTFETMTFNEFLSDRYISIFYSHNFGPLFFSFLNHFPSLEMQHNFGIGNLSNPPDHSQINFKIMNQGFMESGLFMNDILLFNLSGLKTGLGMGFFYRYGAYQNPDFIDNFVAKVSINLDL